MNEALFVFDNAISYLQQTRGIVINPKFQQAVELLATHRVWTCGVGKAGLIAHKLAATLACNSIPAGYIHGAEALHGDFGAIQQEDVLVAFSNSGKTNEVIQVADKAKDLGTKLILISSDNTNIIAQKADVIICYGNIKEACPLGLTPTTSTMVMLAIADALAVAVQIKVGLTYNEYSKNHHSGYLGQIAREKSQSLS